MSVHMLPICPGINDQGAEGITLGNCKGEVVAFCCSGLAIVGVLQT